MLKLCKSCGDTKMFHSRRDRRCPDCKRRHVREANARRTSPSQGSRQAKRDSGKRYYYRNPRVYTMKTALRRARLHDAVPTWVDRAALRRVYEQCPPGLVVDHIWPLAGDDFCGLHVPWNLQYLTPAENGQKGNSRPQL